MAVSVVVVEAGNDAHERGLIRYKRATVTARVGDLSPGGCERAIGKKSPLNVPMDAKVLMTTSN